MLICSRFRLLSSSLSLSAETSINARLAGVFISLWFGFVIEMKKTGDIKQYAPERHEMNVISQKIILDSVRIGKNLSIFASAFNARGVAQPG